jgi:bacterioferritin-associated ferredoxin
MTGAEMVALIAVVGTTLSGILTTLFHSRCSKIRCCGDCINCDREVIHEREEQIVEPRIAQPVEIPNRNDV